MKLQFLPYILLTLFLMPFHHYAQDVHVTIKGGENMVIKVGYYFGDEQRIVPNDGEKGLHEFKSNDSFKLNSKGEISISFKDQLPGMYLISFPPNETPFQFIYEGESLHIVANRVGLINNPQNSVSNNVMAKNLEISARLQDIKTSRKTEAEKQKLTVAAQNEYTAYVSEQTDKEPNALIFKIFRANQLPKAPDGLSQLELRAFYQKNYFRYMDFNDSWLLRTPFFNEKLQYYLEKLVPHEPKSILPAIDNLIKRAKNNKELYRYIITNQLKSSSQGLKVNHDRIYHHIAMKYYKTGKADWVNDAEREEIIDVAEKLDGTFIGDTAEDFKLETLDGTVMNLYDISADYTILIFTRLLNKKSLDFERDLRKVKDQLPENTQVVRMILGEMPEQAKQRAENKPLFGMTATARLLMFGKILGSYNIKGYPEVYLLNKNKTIIFKRPQAKDIPGILKFYSKK